MKKWFIGLLVLCLAAVVVVALTGDKLFTEPVQLPQETHQVNDTPQTSAPEEGAAQAEDESEEASGVDYAAIYALHDPDEVVMTINGKEVLWKEYFYSYYSQAYSMEQYFQRQQYQGQAMGWQSQAAEDGRSFIELLPEMAEENLSQIIVMEQTAEELQVSLLEEEEASVQEAHAQNLEYFCGEGASDEELFQMLWEERYLTEDLYWRVLRFGALNEATYRSLYGEGGELLSEEQVLTWLEENGILSANHILIPTVNLSTREALDEATVQEKTELAQQLAQELQAIEDPVEREKRFLELKELHDADGGAYVFGPGVMVQEFYDGTQALEPGQVSDPVLSVFGYHIILRRPLHADDVVTTAQGSYAARGMAADGLFSQMMTERLDARKVEYAQGFEVPAILDYVNEATA